MLRRFGLATSLVFAGIGGAAVAEEHYVLMVGAGYFPDYIHPAVGDTLRFVNVGTVPMAATASDDSWTTGLVSPGEEFTLPVTSNMRQTFENTLVAGDPGTGAAGFVSNAAIVGVVDYLNRANTTQNTITDTVYVYPGY